MFNWLKKLWDWATLAEISKKLDEAEVRLRLEAQKPKKRPRLYKQAVVVTKGELPKSIKKPSIKGKAK